MSRRSATPTSKGEVKTLEEREEEYKRLNAQLEAQTAKLVFEADQVMRTQNSFLNEPDEIPPDMHDNAPIDPSSLSQDLNESEDPLLSIAAGGLEDLHFDADIASLMMNQFKSAPPSRQRTKTPTRSNMRPSTGATKKTSVTFASKPSTKSLALKKACNIDIADSSVLPEGAEQMGNEAQLRLLKAKVHVLQEELAASNDMLKNQVEIQTQCKQELKSAQEELEKSRKSNLQLTNQLQKTKNQMEQDRKSAEAKLLQLGAANKDVDALKREKKQMTAAHGATEVRLNRALEDAEKLKIQLSKEKQGRKEQHEKSMRELEDLRGSNKRLERVRLESMNLMKKQQALIGVLKKQIVHIEAAKLLNFTEEEFLKTLDWDK